MLSELRIQNFAIIQDLTLNFKPGLVVFTGETVVAKSIILDALNAVLGGRVMPAISAARAIKPLLKPLSY